MNTLILGLYLTALGWLLSRQWLLTRFVAIRHEGHPQYFLAVLMAAVLCAIAALVLKSPMVSFAIGPMREFVEQIPAPEASLGIVRWMAAIAIVATLIVFPLAFVLNFPIRRSTKLAEAIARRVGIWDGIREINKNAQNAGVCVAITLENRKVYIGQINTESPVVAADSQWIVLSPLLSGYRDEHHVLTITTNYSGVYDDLKDKGTAEAEKILSAFSIAISANAVVSIQTFDIQTYAIFQASEETPDVGPTSKSNSIGTTRTSADGGVWFVYLCYCVVIPFVAFVISCGGILYSILIIIIQVLIYLAIIEVYESPEG